MQINGIGSDLNDFIAPDETQGMALRSLRGDRPAIPLVAALTPIPKTSWEQCFHQVSPLESSADCTLKRSRLPTACLEYDTAGGSGRGERPRAIHAIVARTSLPMDQISVSKGGGSRKSAGAQRPSRRTRYSNSHQNCQNNALGAQKWSAVGVETCRISMGRTCSLCIRSRLNRSHQANSATSHSRYYRNAQSRNFESCGLKQLDQGVSQQPRPRYGGNQPHR
jgi:hypothetical protein